MEHSAGVIDIVRLAEDLAATFGDRIAADHRSLRNSQRNIASLLIRQAGDQFGRRFFAANAALCRIMRRKMREFVACCGELEARIKGVG
jgi:hypothetical protein